MKITKKYEFVDLMAECGGFFNAMVVCEENELIKHLGDLFCPCCLEEYWMMYLNEIRDGNTDEDVLKNFTDYSCVYKDILDEGRNVNNTFVLFTDDKNYKLISHYSEIVELLED